MGYSVLEKLNNEFLQAAKSAPKLFKDLAKVEQYIAESYRTRAFTELIQNADDAGSTVFGIHTLNNGFAVGNNGRPFTANDVEALCRSGSSNKRRGSNTIGYRGIGFKSVVNLANQIYVFSKDFNFYFDKASTQNALQNRLDVPLIRIPHQINNSERDIELAALQLAEANNYTTIFVFRNLTSNIFPEELSSFDGSSLIFLNNINHLIIDYQRIHREIKLTYSKQDYRTIVRIEELDSFNEWEVETLDEGNISRVALKRQDDRIFPASLPESVIHSFTPTSEFSGAYIKINGDFSTDPSRKTIDMDQLSEQSLANATDIIVRLIIKILEGDLSRKGFFTPFINIRHQESSRFNSLLLKSIENSLRRTSLKQKGGSLVTFDSLRRKPDWLNYEDYEEICTDGILPVARSIISIYPEVFTFLESLSVKRLSLEDVLARINSVNLSVMGYSQILTKLIKQYQYDLDSHKIKKLKSLRVIPTTTGVVNIGKVSNPNKIASECRNYLINNMDFGDVRKFFKKIGFDWELDSSQPIVNLPAEVESLNQISTNSNISTNQESGQGASNKFSDSIMGSAFKVKPEIKKWRSAENNAAEYLKALESVVSVEDVTQANLGYDFDVLLKRGKKIYIEVKSLSSFSEGFKITNNEYASAHSYGDDYFLALVINEDPFLLKLVPNPIKALKFDKKCERWSWYCENYRDSLKNVEILLS